MPTIDKPHTARYIPGPRIERPPRSLSPMRRRETADEITIQAEVGAEELRELSKLIPISGVRAWLIRGGLEEFTSLLEAHPELLPDIKERISRMMLGENPGSNRKVCNLSIPLGLYNRFNAQLPDRGATSWFIRRLISYFLRELTPQPSLEKLRAQALNNLVFLADHDEGTPQ